MKHILKCDPRPFQAVWDGDKLFEIRKNDRPRDSLPEGECMPIGYQSFEKGDTVELQETVWSATEMSDLQMGPVTRKGKPLEYTGRRIVCMISWTQTGYGLPIDLTVLGLRCVSLHDKGGNWQAEQPDEMKPELLSGDISFTVEDVPFCTRHGQSISHSDCAFCKVTLDARVMRELDKKSVEANSNAVAKSVNANSKPVDAQLRRVGDNHGGGQVTYYTVPVSHPSKAASTGQQPYDAEAIDIINALNMTFAEGEAFKSIWRCAAHRIMTADMRKADGDPLRDAQKVEYYGRQMVGMEERRRG